AGRGHRPGEGVGGRVGAIADGQRHAEGADGGGGGRDRPRDGAGAGVDAQARRQAGGGIGHGAAAGRVSGADRQRDSIADDVALVAGVGDGDGAVYVPLEARRGGVGAVVGDDRRLVGAGRGGAGGDGAANGARASVD